MIIIILVTIILYITAGAAILACSKLTSTEMKNKYTRPKRITIRVGVVLLWPLILLLALLEVILEMIIDFIKMLIE